MARTISKAVPKGRRNRSRMKVLSALFLIASMVAVFSLAYFAPLYEYLKVVRCSGGKQCVLSYYEVGITGYAAMSSGPRKAHTIGKSQEGQLVMSDTTLAKEIDSVTAQFRYFGDRSISGDWIIEFKNDALTETYCTYFIPLSEHMNYIEFDITGCGWTKTKLDDLTILLTNADEASPQDAFVNFLRIKVVYK